MVGMLQAISTTPTVPVVRVPWLEPGILMKSLDAGAYGVICPMVNTRDDAARLVAWTTYAPRGTRSFGPVRALLYGGADYARHANATLVRFAMIETAQALDNLDAILSVEGLDAIYIGPSDLSLALGCKPSFDDVDPPVAQAIEHILERAKAHGVVAGIHNGRRQPRARAHRQGLPLRDRQLRRAPDGVGRPGPARADARLSPSRQGGHMKLGFIGLGIMGAPMCGHLIAAGHTLVVHTRSRVPEALVAAGATACADAQAVASQAEVVFTMLPDTPDVERVLFGERGVAAGLEPGKAVVDMSSISPIETQAFAARITALGCDWLDAPVSGGEVGAKAASLTIMVGGSDTAFARVEPLLRCIGRNITHVGAAGAGQVTKVANQIIVALNIAAVAEALVFAAKAGADPSRVRQALMGGFASSRILEVHGERMIKRSFDPGFRIGLHQKDLNLALQGARALGVALPNTAQTAQLMQACAAHGMAGLDHSALVRALELLAHHELAA
jgi:2-hydroxy-3-oxopropionate reductase